MSLSMGNTIQMYPAPATGVIGQVVQHEAVLVLPSAGEVKVLNETGARIWALADGSRTVRDIASRLCADYDVDPAQAEQDALEFVDDLVQRRILILTDHPHV